MNLNNFEICLMISWIKKKYFCQGQTRQHIDALNFPCMQKSFKRHHQNVGDSKVTFRYKELNSNGEAKAAHIVSLTYGVLLFYFVFMLGLGGSAGLS